MKALSAIFLLGVGTLGVAATPECLVVQLQSKVEENRFWVGDDMSEALDQEGRVIPILWSATDATFTSMLQNSRSKYPTIPSEKDALKFAAEHKIGYLLTMVVDRAGGQVIATGKLFRGGRSIWTETRTQGIQVNGVGSSESDALSLARTWTILLGTGPLKDLPAKTRIESPPIEPGPVQTHDLNAAPLPVPPPSSEEARKRAQQLIKDDRASEAVLLLRDTVDANPFDVDARLALVETLIALNQNELAAEEALRAAELSPDGNAMRLLAARAYLKLGKISDAEAALNEALVRDGSGHNASLIRGEIALIKGEAQKAIDAYSDALQTKNSYDARLGRALAYSFIGRQELLTEDLKQMPVPTEGQRLEAYERTMRYVATRVDVLVTRVRATMQDGMLKAKDPTVLQAAVLSSDIATTLDQLVAFMAPPTPHLLSHQKRELAHKLLIQATSEAIAFAQRGEEDMINDIAITLGDAVRRYTALKAEFESERR